jgi:hypothetical protein
VGGNRGKAIGVIQVKSGNRSGHDAPKEAFERYVGDAFVRWHNAMTGRSFAFLARPESCPDLIYRDPSGELGIEVTSAHYGPDWWDVFYQQARPSRSGRRFAATYIPDARLIANANEALAKKWEKKELPRDCVVVLFAPVFMTQEDFEQFLLAIHGPKQPMASPAYVGAWRSTRRVGATEFWWGRVEGAPTG